MPLHSHLASGSLSIEHRELGLATQLMDRLLEGWGKWARAGIRLGPIPAAVLLRMKYTLEGGHELVLSDDRFTLVDARIARLPQQLKRTVFLEYTYDLPWSAKLAHAGLNRHGYRQLLHAAQWALYASLQVELGQWGVA